MRTIELPNIPDELYQQIEKLARLRGSSVSDVATDVIARAMARSDETEDALLAEIRAEREAMANRGVWITVDDIQDAKVRGRK